MSQNLAPALAAAHLSPKVYGSDTSWQLENYADSLAASPARSSLGRDRLALLRRDPDGDEQPARARRPSLDQIVTECAPNLGHYAVPEIAIGAMRNWASEVTLWNIATDPAGGPVEAPNSGCHGCRGLVTINESTHRVTFNPDYYELGQIGAFLQSGAWRISSNNFVSLPPPAVGVLGHLGAGRRRLPQPRRQPHARRLQQLEVDHRASPWPGAVGTSPTRCPGARR